MLILRLMAWPLVMGLGFCLVVWFYDLTNSTSMWREIDELTWISSSSWLVAPALAWGLVPAAWGRPAFAIWTLAAGGTAALVSALVLFGSFLYVSGAWDFLDGSAMEFLDLMANFGNTSVEDAVWSPGILSLYLLVPSVGYAITLGMISWRLALIYLLASALGAVAAFFLYYTFAVALSDLMAGLQWEPGVRSILPLMFVLAALVGLFGAIAMIAWAVFGGPAQEETEW